MLKIITPIAIAALTVLSIAPQSQAIPINLESILIRPRADGTTKVKAVIGIGTQPDYSSRWEGRGRREWEIQREREAERRRYRYYQRGDRYSDYGREYRRDRY
jgi:hypothetical protein